MKSDVSINIAFEYSSREFFRLFDCGVYMMSDSLGIRATWLIE